MDQHKEVTATVEIRNARPEDYAQWKVLWDGYQAFYGRSGATALAPQITETTWARIHDAAEPVHALVAVREDELLGIAHYLYHRSTSMIGLNCYLQDLFTSEAARGQGVGRALIEELYRRAGADGAERVYWQTQPGNATARRLYDAVAEEAGFMVYRHLL